MIHITAFAEKICTDPGHCHRSPVQVMIEVEIMNRRFEITRDGKSFNLRVDGGPAKFDLSRERLIEEIRRELT